MLCYVFLVSVCGLLLSLYGLFIERKLAENKAYKAVCDLSDKVSCTKTFLSPWAKLLGFSNIYLGIAVYSLSMLLALFNQVQFVFVLSCLLVLGSIFFAYILYTKVKTFCLLCISIYVVNILLWIAAFKAFMQ